MRKILSLFAVMLFLGVTQMWGANLTKTEGFETKAASTTYNSTVTISEAESDCGIGWSIFYGTVSTNDKISGSQSAQMRYYSSSDNRGYVQSTTAVEGLSNVAFKARVSSLDMKLTVSYSADGSAWTALATNVAFAQTGAQGVQNLNYDIPSGGKYIKFEVAEGSTKPSSSNIKLIIDSVVFTYAEPVEPVVLPDTLDVSNVSFRSEGMPNYVITEGDTAGTYFDMGAHDSSNDTLLYAEWDVTIQPLKYNLAVDVYNTNSWSIQLYLLNQAGDTVKALRYKGHSGEKGQFPIGSLDLSDLQAGNYKLRAHAATAWSAMKLKDIIFTADYQGVSVNLPGILLPAYAELSAGASVTNDAIAFKPSTANNEYAIWNVSFAEAGNYSVTIDMTASNGHTYGVALLSADGQTQVDAVAEEQAWDTGVKELGTITVPAAGNYQVKLTNATQWSEAVINSITIAAPIGGPVYYLVGTMNNWTPAEAYKFEENPGAEGEYMLTAALAAGDSIKVVGVVGNTTTWYPDQAANYAVDADHAGATKKIYFRPDGQGGEGWYYGVFFVEENPAPQGCDWNNIPWVEGEPANQYKVCKEGAYPGVVNIQQPGWAAEKGIYMTFENAVFGNFSLDTTKYAIDGAGVVFYLSAFTAKETEVTVQNNNAVVTFTVYNENGTEPQPHSYTVAGNSEVLFINSWDPEVIENDLEPIVGGDYTHAWGKDSVLLEAGNVEFKVCVNHAWTEAYPAENYNLAIAENGYYDVEIFFNDQTKAVYAEATKVGEAPIVGVETIYNWAKDSADQVGATIFGGNSNITTGTVKIHENSDDVNGIKFGSSYVYADGKWIAIKPAEGGFKAGDILSVSVVFNNSDATKYCMVDLRAADGDTRIWMSDSLSTLNGRNAGDPIVQTYTLEADQDSLFLGRYGNTGMFVTLLKVDRAVTPEPVHTYTVAGAPATLFGQDWKPAYEANDMQHLVGSEYLYIWAKDSVTLPAGNIEFKVCEDHAWTHAWPSENYVLPIAESGIYNIAIYFNPLAEADSLRIRATADKVGSAVVIPAVKMHGNFTGSWADTKEFTLAADSLTASLKLNLAEGNFEFGMKFDGTWKANGANITRTENTACLATGDGNMHIAADQEGEYTFTYTFATQTLEVTYPKLIPHYNVAEAIAAGLQENDLVYVRGIVTKMEFKGTNFAKYGSVNIYVADATGAEGEFEFYNCYSLNADTFRTSDPAYDATSTAWAQFQAVTDGNGKTVHVGDMVEAYGKYKLYNTTHELNTGCYLTLIEEPAPSLIYDVKLFNRDWTPDTISTVNWDGINEKVIINIIPGKNDAWQGQVWLKLPMDVKKEKEYDLTFKIKANKTFGGSIVKYQENAEMLFDNQLALTADVETIYESKNMPGVLAAGDVTGNGVLCMSFGYCPDSTLIEMYAISIVEHDPTTAPAKFYVTGNDAFTVDAGLTTADSWNSKAFKSESDTMTFALKAGAAYQLKVCVDGTWSTVKGYNDLTEVTPGIIDADGNNHNIGFSLVEDGDVMVIYTGEVFKVVGNFVTQGLNDIDASVKAVKVLRNGQIFILRGDKVYTVTGQPVK